MRSLFLSLVAAAMMVVTAHADPTGKYSVSGSNPDNDDKYTGTVEVTRTGETYKVVWQIGDDVFNGTAIPGYIEVGEYVAGAATIDDTVLSVGYSSGDSFGIAIYVLKDSGVWEGVWTYDGGTKVATELWVPF